MKNLFISVVCIDPFYIELGRGHGGDIETNWEFGLSFNQETNSGLATAEMVSILSEKISAQVCRITAIPEALRKAATDGIYVMRKLELRKLTMQLDFDSYLTTKATELAKCLHSEDDSVKFEFSTSLHLGEPTEAKEASFAVMIATHAHLTKVDNQIYVVHHSKPATIVTGNDSTAWLSQEKVNCTCKMFEEGGILFNNVGHHILREALNSMVENSQE